jgi:cyclic beta-1,2-glucan synthetase
MSDRQDGAVPGLACFNGWGGFNAAGEYEIRLHGDELPPAPWVNVIANPSAGFIVSEGGSGPTWAVSSSFFRLTPWANDPVTDPAGECIYLRDEATREIWTPTAAPVRESTPYTTRHGAGYSVFEHTHDGIRTSLRAGVPESDPVKIQVLSVTNDGTTPRRISLTGYVEWILGVDRERTEGHVRTAVVRERSAMLVANTFEAELEGQVAFYAASEPLSTFTNDRRSFIGRNGAIESPAGLTSASLDEREDNVSDACAALQVIITLQPAETRDVTFLLGSAGSREEALALIERYGIPRDANAAIDSAAARWQERLATIRVVTPEPTFDLIMNGWCVYQALSCRMWGRIALYQSSGAYGFRDQLQDAMAFVYVEPLLARSHIVAAASRQFEEGDVQHWWHPHSGRGVRTRFADDLIWLPFVVNHYVRVAGDSSVLDEQAGYVRSRQLHPGEDELYDVPEISDRVSSVYDHCVFALRRACTKGVHGLPLIGGGDWNDGMNRVGIDGKGESVWLAWFLCKTLREFAEHARARGDVAVADELVELARGYNDAVEETSWDGAWYRRAYYDDGAPLGSRGNTECMIDSIAQSWSVISEAGDPARARTAMQSFDEHLVLDDARLLMLLTPAFDRGVHDPGYIQGYLPGVRENGAQYTHAATWSVLATAMLGDGDRALELFQMLNPVTHTLTPEAVSVYKVEPYVVAADVYTAEGHLGRGGWTWYTGSASWLYRVGLEGILGFKKRGEVLTIDPCIPSGWKGFAIDYRYGATTYSIKVENPDGVQRGVRSVSVDGVSVEGGVPLVDDRRRREVIVTLGAG